ncbi:hypothetical protein [Actinomyces sp.]
MMTADLTITESMLTRMANKFEDIQDQVGTSSASLPISVDAGVASSIIIDLMETLDYSGTEFASQCTHFADNLHSLISQHKESDKEATLQFQKLKEQINL